MLGTALDKGFSLVWAIVKMNLYFLLLSLMGGVVLGVGPAFQTLCDLYLEFDKNWQALTFRRAFTTWKANFKLGNRNFYAYCLTVAIMSYNLYLALQIKQLLFFVISFVLIFVILLASATYLFVCLYTSAYVLNFRSLLNLALTTTFLNFANFFRLLFGILGIVMVSWMMKGIFIFGTFAMLAYWSVISTVDVRKVMAFKLLGENTTH